MWHVIGCPNGKVDPECTRFLHVDQSTIPGDAISTLLSLLYSSAWLELCQDRRCAAVYCVQILLMQTDRFSNQRAPSATRGCYKMLWVTPCSQYTWATATLCYKRTSQARMFQSEKTRGPTIKLRFQARRHKLLTGTDRPAKAPLCAPGFKKISIQEFIFQVILRIGVGF